MTEKPSTQTTPDSAVFVSYASQDVAVANAIVEALEKHGLRCWIAPRDVRAGAQYADAIVRAISSAKALVLVLSANAIASSHVGKEIERASSKKRPIIALRVDAAPLTPALEYFLSESQWIEAQAGHLEAAYARLIDAIREPDRTAPNDIPAVVSEAMTALASNPKSRRSRILLAAGLAVVAVTFAALWAANFWPAKRVAAEQTTTIAATAVSEKSIAVLPFTDMSAEKNQEYMSDGMAEEILNLLAQVPDLKVIARTSSFTFKGQNIEIADIAKKLKVAHVLEGSVRTSGNKLRVTAQLIRTSDSTHLWSESYDRSLDDIFAVQDEIANAVVSELKIKLLDSAPKAKGRDPKAHALFLQARNIADQYTALALEQAISLYQQALEIDPRYGEAWDGLASIYGNQALDGLRPREEGFRLASDAAQKALALDPQSAQAHARLGWIAIYYDGDLRSAARHLSHALALDSGNTEAIKMAVALLRRIDRLDRAIQFAEHALVYDPVNSDAHFDLGRAHYFARHWDAAITEFRTALALSPSSLGGRAVLGEVLVLQGNARAALEEIKFETDDGWRLEVTSLAHHALGQAAASEAAWIELTEKYGHLFAVSVVETAAFRGDVESAFKWLEKAAQLRDPALGQIPFSPLCDNLHKDPRWLPFLRKQGMAPEQLAAIKFEVTLPQ